jgi:AcrR family transcriptional regulator
VALLQGRCFSPPKKVRLDCLFLRPQADLVSAPKQERSRVTRLRLLDATVECLVDHGWSGATTTLIAERAGVSRGAQLHHYPTRAALVMDAVEHLAHRRATELRAEAASLASDDPEGRLDGVLALLAAAFTGPLFVAALELWVAARTDPDLRAALLPLEARLGRDLHRLAVDLLGVDESRPGVRESVQASLDLLRGLGVANLLADDSDRRAGLLAVWRDRFATVLRAETAGSGVDAGRGGEGRA